MRTTGSVCGSKLASRPRTSRAIGYAVQAVRAAGKRLLDDEAQELLEPVRRDEIGARQDPLQLLFDRLGRRREPTAMTCMVGCGIGRQQAFPQKPIHVTLQ